MQYCSCGSQLVESARFCHRCGKATFEEIEAVEPVEYVLPTVAAPSAAALETEMLSEINFGNKTAVRVSLLVAAMAMVVLVSISPLAGMTVFGVIFPTVFAGLASVFLYQRRTGVGLSIKAGARLGWITGVFIFAFFLVLFTISFIPAMEAGEFAKIPDQALKGKMPEADLARVKELLANPASLSMLIVFFMAVYFVIASTLTSIGGMLGAKFLGRNQSLQR